METRLEALQLEEGSVGIDEQGRPDEVGRALLAAKGYGAEAFTTLHHDWKDANLEELLALCRPATDSALFLDHWTISAEDGRLRTTDALLRAGFEATRCYCANPDEAIVARVRERGAHAEQSTFAHALRTTWRDRAFDVVYADFCYASAERAIGDLEALFTSGATQRRPRVLAWTLTGRAEGGLHQRLAKVHDFLERRGYRPALESMTASWRTFGPSSVVTGFYCVCGSAPVA